MRLPSTAQLQAMKPINIIGTPMININTDSATLSPIVLDWAFGEGCKACGISWSLGAAAGVLAMDAPQAVQK